MSDRRTLRPPPAQLREWVRKSIAATARDDWPPTSFRSYEKEYGLFGLHGTQLCLWFLAPDGTVFEKDLDRVARPEPVPADDPSALNAVAQAARTHPELRELLPDRPAEGRDCPHCRGSGDADQGWPCGCGGLGWILPSR